MSAKDTRDSHSTHSRQRGERGEAMAKGGLNGRAQGESRRRGRSRMDVVASCVIRR
jgi:hypothetical protein